MSIEYILYPLLLNNLTALKTGNIYIDTIFIGIFGIIFYIYNNRSMSKRINKKIYNFIFPNNHTKITFKNEGKDRSMSFKSLMHYVHFNNYDNIKQIRERVRFTWNRDDEYVETRDRGYEIDQEDEFKFTDDIFGKIYEEVKEKNRHRDNTEFQDIYTLEVYSSKLSLNELEKWINERNKEYQKYLKQRISDKQMLFTVSWTPKHKSIEIEDNEWDCYATFENSYFRNKKEIISKIDFFLNNEEWYKDRGIPYNLGILLYGEPGGGKSRFIKQLINYTKRHAIDIKLNDGFDFDALRHLIQNENIDTDHIIEQKNRIIIFEDIDAVGETLKDRKLKEKEKKNKNTGSEMLETLNKMAKSQNKETNNIDESDIKSKFIKVESGNMCETNNNLSYFLNILDGLNECNGRIIIMTTNRINYLDEAIIRPGRIDIKIECTKCTTEDIDGVLKCFYKDDYKYGIENIRSDIDKKYTSAEVINILRSDKDFDKIKHYFIK